MHDPLTLAASIPAAVGLAGNTLQLGTTALELLGKVRRELDTEEVSEELLRLALLEADHNLALLDVLKVSPLTESTREGLLNASRLLRTEAITALLIQWPELKELPGEPEDRSRAAKERWEKGLKERPVHEQILANARYVAARVAVLVSLAQIDGAAVKTLRLGVRCRNLRDAHAELRRLLTTTEGGVSTLGNSRSR